MNIASVSLRNLRVRLLASVLTATSVMVGTALVAALWLMIAQTKDRYSASYSGYGAVVGPKEGSPLTLVLSTVLNLGYPPGVVTMDVYRDLREGRLARKLRTRYAIPQARGDYYGGFPIVGTTDEWFTKFTRSRQPGGEREVLAFAEGEHWTFGHEDLVAFAEAESAELQHGEPEDGAGTGPRPEWLRAVVGATVAKELGLGVGSTFVPVHGEHEEVAHHHEEAETRVVGVLAATGTPIDRCIYVPIAMFLSLEGHEAIRADTQELEAGSVVMSAIVYDGLHPLSAGWLRREFQTRADAQAAWPSVEIQQFLAVIGDYADILRVVSWLVIAVAAIGICVALYNTMNERRREIAIMRSLGARRGQILSIILLEATLVSFLGAVAGIVLCHLLAWAARDAVAARTSVVLDWTAFSADELWLILGVTVLGAVVGVLPAVKGSMTEVADNLGPVS